MGRFNYFLRLRIRCRGIDLWVFVGGGWFAGGDDLAEAFG